jgi:hypothetical protein
MRISMLTPEFSAIALAGAITGTTASPVSLQRSVGRRLSWHG